MNPGPAFLAAAVLAVAAPLAASPGDVPHRHGLRLARRVDARTVALLFGASFAAKPGAWAGSYRVMSANDAVYRGGKRPSSVEVVEAEDLPALAALPAYRRTRVVLHLPEPLEPRHRYWVQVLGRDHQPVTGGVAAGWIEESSDAREREAAADNRLGVRTVEVLSPVVLKLTVGDALDAAAFDADPGAVLVQSPGDPAWRAGRRSVKVGRATRAECFVTEGWPYRPLLVHEIFAVLDRPLPPGRAFAVTLGRPGTPLTSGADRTRLVLDRTAVNPAIAANQVGYLPEARRKYAYYGAWLGSLGALDVSPWAARFEVRDEATDRVVLEGRPALRHRPGQPETRAEVDLSGAEVWEMDLSALAAPGRYSVAIPGAGRSLPFRVAGDAYSVPFETMMTGVLHQRCGIEMRPPWSDFPRSACHRNRTEPTDFAKADEKSNWSQLPRHVTGPAVDLPGGHHDAGDYDPRAHLEIAELAFLAYELRPDAHADGQLRIPEAGNGVPDVLDEGRWALDLWMRLQLPDGSVRGGIESDGDPDFVTPPDLDDRREFAFAPTPVATLRFAGSAAQAAHLWGRLGFARDAARFENAARRAWAWARPRAGDAERDAVALAAAQLYRLRGDAAFHDAFVEASVFTKDAFAEPVRYQVWDQRLASFIWAFAAEPGSTLSQRIVASFRREAEEWMRAAETTAYRFCKHPSAPGVWGSGAHPMWMVELAEAYALTGDPRMLDWIRLTCDWALGCNPAGRVYTTRLGARPISSPLHLTSRYAPGGPIPGLECQGPSPQTGGIAATSATSTWPGAALSPAGRWPDQQTYSDVAFVPAMNEGTVVDQMRSAVAYGVLLPARVLRPAAPGSAP